MQKNIRTIAFLGASTVAGKADREGGGFAERFSIWFERERGGKTLIFGRDGETIKGMLERLEDEVSKCPTDLIVILTGINDTRRQGSSSSPSMTDQQSYRNQFSTLLVNAKKLAKVVVFSPFSIDDSKTSPLKGTELYYSNSTAAEYVKIQEEVCQAEAVLFVNLFTKFDAAKLAGFWYRDGLHFNASGHQAIAEEVISFVSEKFI